MIQVRYINPFVIAEFGKHGELLSMILKSKHNRVEPTPGSLVPGQISGSKNNELIRSICILYKQTRAHDVDAVFIRAIIEKLAIIFGRGKLPGI